MSWPLVKASDVIDVRDGTHDSPKYIESGIPLVTSKNLVDGGIDYDSCQFISEEDHVAISKRSAVDNGDILYAMIGTIGNPVIVEKRFDFSIKNVALFKFNNHSVFNRYVYHFLNSEGAIRQLLQQSRGGTQKFVSLGNLRDLKIPLPPLEEQKRISSILDKADAIRRKRQQAIKLADDFLSAEFLKRFGDPKDSPFGSRSLKDVTLKITDGAHFTPTYTDSGVPFLRVTDINRDTVDWSQVKYIPLEEHQELIKRCKPEKGDVLYSKNGTIGVPKLIDWDQEFSIFVSLCLIKPDPKFLRGRYLFSFLQTPFALKQATQKAKSATVTNLHLIEIKEIKLPVPSLAVQDEWIDFVSRFNDTRDRLIQSLEKSNEVFNSLSQKAFSGDL